MFKYVRNSDAPIEVKRAALLLLSYASCVLLGTIFYAIQTDFENTKELIRGLVRFGGVGYISLWLLSLQKASWWFAVGASGLFSLIGVVAMGMLLYVGVSFDSSFLIKAFSLVFPLYFLIHAFLILINSETKSLFLEKNA